jgi:hypothetical protein
MTNKYYKLEGRTVVETDCMDWERSIERDSRIVKQDTSPDGKWISTIFLGLDHSFGDGEPLLFETMVFPKEGEWSELDVQRYSTYEEAEKGHQELVEKYSTPPEENITTNFIVKPSEAMDNLKIGEKVYMPNSLGGDEIIVTITKFKDGFVYFKGDELEIGIPMSKKIDEMPNQEVVMENKETGEKRTLTVRTPYFRKAPELN